MKQQYVGDLLVSTVSLGEGKGFETAVLTSEYQDMYKKVFSDTRNAAECAHARIVRRLKAE